MKVGEAKDKIHDTIKKAHRDWVNGNLSNTIEAIVALPKSAAAYVTAAVAMRLDKASSDMFMLRMASEAVGELIID